MLGVVNGWASQLEGGDLGGVVGAGGVGAPVGFAGDGRQVRAVGSVDEAGDLADDVEQLLGDQEVVDEFAGAAVDASPERLRSYLKKMGRETWNYIDWLAHAKNAGSLDGDIGICGEPPSGHLHGRPHPWGPGRPRALPALRLLLHGRRPMPTLRLGGLGLPGARGPRDQR